jgi:hypothetical protein
MLPPAIRRAPRATERPRIVRRTMPPAFDKKLLLEPLPRPPSVDLTPGPYLDYRRSLTPEGGILIVYKDLDTRLRQIIWRIFAWTAYTSLEAWFLLNHSPVQSAAINVLCLLATAGLNFLIVWRLPEVYRSVEIRPDCMILEGADVFWRLQMENGLPAFQPDEKGNQALSGIYGTRFVEYLTVRRFDDYDRMPEVFAAHLNEAMQQLWIIAQGLGKSRTGSSPRQRY